MGRAWHRALKLAGGASENVNKGGGGAEGQGRKDAAEAAVTTFHRYISVTMQYFDNPPTALGASHRFAQYVPFFKR